METKTTTKKEKTYDMFDMLSIFIWGNICMFIIWYLRS